MPPPEDSRFLKVVIRCDRPEIDADRAEVAMEEV
jgi:hypothetical protein